MFLWLRHILLCIATFCVLGSISAKAEISSDNPDKGLSGREENFYVGQYGAKLVPEQMRVFISPVAGNVTGIADPGKRYLKGEIIAKLNEADIKLEKEELELTLLKDKVEKNEEINKLAKEKEELSFILSLPKNERRFLGTNSKEVDSRILTTLDDKIMLLQKELDTLGKKKQAEFEKKEEAYIIRMPFEGRIQYPFVLKNEHDESVYVESSKDIVTVCDDSAFYMTVSISSPEITRIEDPSVFRLVAELDNGEKLEGTFSYRRIQKNQSSGLNSETLFFFFKLADQYRETAYNMLGVPLTAKLYYRGNENVVALSKMQLSSLPMAKNSSTWQELLEAARPGYQLILVGETHIIARKQ